MSDHNPLVLSLETVIDWGPKPFRTFDAWLLNPEFKNFIRNEWSNLPNVSLSKKLKVLKYPLREWSKRHFAHLDTKISELESVVHELERVSDNRCLSTVEKARLYAAQNLNQTRVQMRA